LSRFGIGCTLLRSNILKKPHAGGFLVLAFAAPLA
jgi:hypothetical protein